jgi:hypothetical protein
MLYMALQSYEHTRFHRGGAGIAAMNMRGGAAMPVAVDMPMVMASPAVGVSLADCDVEDAERIPGWLYIHTCSYSCYCC